MLRAGMKMIGFPRGRPVIIELIEKVVIPGNRACMGYTTKRVNKVPEGATPELVPISCYNLIKHWKPITEALEVLYGDSNEL